MDMWWKIYTDPTKKIANNPAQFYTFWPIFSHMNHCVSWNFRLSTFGATFVREMPGWNWNTHQHCEERARKCRCKCQQSGRPGPINKGRCFFLFGWMELSQMWVWMIIDHIKIMTEILRTRITRHNTRTGATWIHLVSTFAALVLSNASWYFYHWRYEILCCKESNQRLFKKSSLSRVLVRFESTLCFLAGSLVAWLLQHYLKQMKDFKANRGLQNMMRTKTHPIKLTKFMVMVDWFIDVRHARCNI